jgi:hypothetical protein
MLRAAHFLALRSFHRLLARAAAMIVCGAAADPENRFGADALIGITA